MSDVLFSKIGYKRLPLSRIDRKPEAMLYWPVLSSFAPVANSLEKFRSQYPEGALVSDLLTIQDGQYVVRTRIVQKGEMLATGLAASVDVQIAEDKARARAIATLIVASQALAQDSSNGSANGLKEAEPAVQTPTVAAPPVSSRSSNEMIESEPALPIADETPPEEPVEEEDLSPPIDAIEESGAEDSVAPTKTSAATLALESFNTSASPVDLSDVIAQTDVELTRLGWTSVQGREYLEKTYGKRSRQQLTDEELMSFLLYLEDQS